MIVSRSSLLDDLLALLASPLGVDASTQLSRVHGMGEDGTALGTFASPASNEVILTALEEDKASQVIAELEAFQDRSAARRSGGRLPLRVFILPCTQAL